jgi:hypothetical protein
LPLPGCMGCLKYACWPSYIGPCRQNTMISIGS